MQAGAGTVTARVFVNYKGSDTIEKVPLCNVAHALLRTASEHCCASSERSRTVGDDKVGWTIGCIRFLTAQVVLTVSVPPPFAVSQDLIVLPSLTGNAQTPVRSHGRFRFTAH